MSFTVEGTDIPDEVRELIRLQDQRIRRLEGMVTELLKAASTGETLGTHGELMASTLSDDRYRRLFRRQVKEAGWTVRDDEWDRGVEPDWVWEHLAEDEAVDAWKDEHPLHPSGY